MISRSTDELCTCGHLRSEHIFIGNAARSGGKCTSLRGRLCCSDDDPCGCTAFVLKPVLTAGIDIPSSMTHHGALPLGTQVRQQSAGPKAAPSRLPEGVRVAASRAHPKLVYLMIHHETVTPEVALTIAEEITRVANEAKQASMNVDGATTRATRDTIKKRLDDVEAQLSRLIGVSESDERFSHVEHLEAERAALIETLFTLRQRED